VSTIYGEILVTDQHYFSDQEPIILFTYFAHIPSLALYVYIGFPADAIRVSKTSVI